MYSRFRQDGKHFVLTSQTTQLRRETSRDGYRKCAGKYFQLPLAVVDIRRRRILRSLLVNKYLHMKTKEKTLMYTRKKRATHEFTSF